MTKPRKGMTCSTGKRRYRDRTEARNALRNILRTVRPGKLPTRLYSCPHCLGYHLTTQDRRT